MARAKILEDLFHDALKEVHYAEKKIFKLLPKMVHATFNDDLRFIFVAHHLKTEAHIRRLEKVFMFIGKAPRRKTCEMIARLVFEAEKFTRDYKNSIPPQDGLVAFAQAVERYEVSRYSTLVSWAEQLGLADAGDLLAETLEEEKHTNELLTTVATAPTFGPPETGAKKYVGAKLLSGLAAPGRTFRSATGLNARRGSVSGVNLRSDLVPPTLPK